jgi:hypothetical protein
MPARVRRRHCRLPPTSVDNRASSRVGPMNPQVSLDNTWIGSELLYRAVEHDGASLKNIVVV